MDASEKDQIKFKFTLIVMNWIRLNYHSKNDESKQFPSDIIQLIVNIFLYENIKILQFHEEFKDPTVTLHDDRTRATFATTAGKSAHVMVDCNPAKSGKHVWRIQV